jgi:nitroimidazol reductase NimA-like FMN-containing flavoprotein (pyridoxamine 5'-phosphate oxidase superfamily)
MGRRTAPAELSELARRVAERRQALGMSRDVLARRAGMTSRYLEYLLDADTGAGFDDDGLLRIAAALDMPYEDLVHGAAEPPPGRSGPAPAPGLMRLTETECWDRLGAHGVGRVALPAEPGPVVLPVNYVIDARTVAYRTSPRGGAALKDGTAASFQADHIDERHSTGWSVLITGTAERVDDAAAADRLARQEAGGPWAGGSRPLWIRIRPSGVTGRRITEGAGNGTQHAGRVGPPAGRSDGPEGGGPGDGPEGGRFAP